MSLTKSIPELELTVTEAWPPSAKGRGMGPAGYKSSAKQMTKETVGGYGVERSETEPSVTTNSNSKALEKMIYHKGRKKADSEESAFWV